MTNPRDDRGGQPDGAGDSQTFRRLVGHLIATILLAVLAAVAVWIVLGSDAPADGSGWGRTAIMPAQTL